MHLARRRQDGGTASAARLPEFWTRHAALLRSWQTDSKAHCALSVAHATRLLSHRRTAARRAAASGERGTGQRDICPYAPARPFHCSDLALLCSEAKAETALCTWRRSCEAAFVSFYDVDCFCDSGVSASDRSAVRQPFAVRALPPSHEKYFHKRCVTPIMTSRLLAASHDFRADPRFISITTQQRDDASDVNLSSLSVGRSRRVVSLIGRRSPSAQSRACLHCTSPRMTPPQRGESA